MRAMMIGALLGLLALPGLALAKDKLPAAPQPFGFVLGATTEAQARELCLAEKAGATARGLVDTRPAPDAAPAPVANPRGVLLEVAGLPMPGLEGTRLGFFDDRLYAIVYRFTAQHDTRLLLQQLEQKYGKPSTPAGLARRYEWRFQDVSLALIDEVQGTDSLVFLHQGLHQALVESSQLLWKQHIGRSMDGQRGF